MCLLAICIACFWLISLFLRHGLIAQASHKPKQPSSFIASGRSDLRNAFILEWIHMPSCRRCHWRNVTRALSCSTWSLPIWQHLCLSKQWRRSSATCSICPDVPQSHQPWSQSQPYFEVVKHSTTTMQNVTITSYIMVINCHYFIPHKNYNCQFTNYIDVCILKKTAFYKAC